MKKFQLNQKIDVDNAQQVEKDGKQYILAKATLLQEGVFNNILHLKQIFKNYCTSFNGKNIFISHKDETLIDNLGDEIGKIYNASCDNSLEADLYFDVERLESTEDGKKILTKLKENESIALSVAYEGEGLYGKNTYISSNDVKEYSMLATKMGGRHLAILLDEAPACTIEEGCGVNIERFKKSLKKFFNQSKGEKMCNECKEEIVNLKLELADKGKEVGNLTKRLSEKEEKITSFELEKSKAEEKEKEKEITELKAKGFNIDFSKLSKQELVSMNEIGTQNLKKENKLNKETLEL